VDPGEVTLELPGFSKEKPGPAGRPLASLLEGARLQGKAVGLAVTCRVTHATPAAFYAHVPSRKQESDIMLQGVYQGMDVVLGGGLGYLLPKNQKGKRKDGLDLSQVLKKKDYTLVRTAQELAKVTKGRVFGLFSKSHMAAELDRAQLAPTEPSLAKMTEKAIQLLSQDPDGFFLMVEASQVDWAAHANDPAHLLGDMAAFDQAAAVALDFARKNPDTLLVVLSDHATGGMALGNKRSNQDYGATNRDRLIAPLKAMKVTAPTLWKSLGPDPTPASLKKAVKEQWGCQLNDSQAKEILDYAAWAKRQGKGKSGFDGLGEVVSRDFTIVGWTTHGHVGDQIPLYAAGPAAPIGLLDMAGVGRHLAEAMGIDLAELNARLFNDAATAFGPQAVSLDQSDGNRPAVLIKHKGRAARLPVNTNLLKMGGKTLQLEGLVIWDAKHQKAYIPRQAIELIKG
jgi:alkaline phosphatase